MYFYKVFADSVYMMLQGCLVTLCADSSLHLWQLNVRDGGESFIEEVRCLSAETRSS